MLGPTLRLDDLFGQVGGRSMGDRIVHVQEVELVIDDYVNHRTREGRFIGRVVEEGIIRNAHFVIEDIRIKLVEPDRLLIGDEMHLVAFVGKRFSQLRRQDAATAEGRITNNSYSHRFEGIRKRES